MFKPLAISEQVIVLTGATNPTGLAIAKLAAIKGAKLVLSSLDEELLNKLLQEIHSYGVDVVGAVADVTNYEDLESLANEAISHFGRIDTWINNEGSSLYGYLLDSEIVEEQELFDINFWGTRYASQIAVESMKERGGTLINMGSEISTITQPLLGIHSASKLAVKAFTDALRTEIRDKKLPVEVSLIHTNTITSPLREFKEGKNQEVKSEDLPIDAAGAILKCAEEPQRDVYLGGPAKLSAILETFFPKVKDIVAETKLKDHRLIPEVPNEKITTTELLKSVIEALKILRFKSSY